MDNGAGDGRRGRSGDPLGVREAVDDVDDCLSAAKLSAGLPVFMEDLLDPIGDPVGVSSGEKRSAAQMKFDDSTVLKRQLCVWRCHWGNARNVSLFLLPPFFPIWMTSHCPVCYLPTFFYP